MTAFLSQVKEWIEATLGVPQHIVVRLFWTGVVIVVYALLRWIAAALVDRRVKDVARQYVLSKTLEYILGFIGLLALVRVWVGGIAGLASYLGILSAGLAIALQDPISNLAGWIFIVTRKPFVIGDRVQIGQHAGDVVDLRLFQFSLVEIGNWVHADQSTGRLIHVPNNSVFKQTVANYTQGFNFIWHEIPVIVTFESNWERAKEILTEIAERHTAIQSEHAEREVRKAARKYLIFFQHLTPIVWTSVAAHGIELTIRYLCEPRKRRSSEAAIWEDILKSFAAVDDIDFAYPTQRFYDNAVEGKEGASIRGRMQK